MTTIAETASLYRRLSNQLFSRHAELRAQLQAATGTAAAIGRDAAEVMDFKDVAAEEARFVVDEAALAHAAAELKEVAAALRRLDDASYGFCQDCGDAIDERRLLALPATRFCTDCQARHERPAGLRR